MSEWKKKILGDIISIKGGFSYKGKFIGTGNSYLLGMGCVSFRDKFLHSGARAYSGKSPESYFVRPGDLVLATRQQSDNLPILGVPAIVPDDYKGKNVIAGTNLYIVKNESEIDNKFLYWLLKSPMYRNHILSCSKGTTVRMITKDAVESFEFYCPTKAEREQITDTLWSIENKMDLLHRQNKTLEQLAETLFRQWFVEEVDENWEIGRLGEEIELVYGKALKEEIRTGNGFPVVGSSGIVGFHSDYLVEAPGIVIGRKGTLGKVTYLFENFFPIDTTYFIKSRRTSDGLFYEYFLLKNINFEELNSDSAVPGLNRDIALSTEIRIPSIENVREFNFQCSAIFIKINSNTRQIETLTKLRDALLPKLMSGEIKLNIGKDDI